MIEFKNDGEIERPLNGQNKSRLRIIGVGRAGVGAVDEIVLHGTEVYDLLALDTDRQMIEASVAGDKILLGFDCLRGLGTNGDPELAVEALESEEDVLRKAIEGCDHLIIITGCGGGTGGTVTHNLLREARAAGVNTAVLAVLPYRFEGKRRQAVAMEDIRRMRTTADAVLVFANDRAAIIPDAAKNPQAGFHFVNETLARTTEALAKIFCKRGILQLGFGDVRSLFGRYEGLETLENAWSSHALGAIEEDPAEFVDRLLECPLVDSDDVWKLADHAILILSGGHDLAIGDVQEIVERLQNRLPRQIPIAVNANLDEANQGLLRGTLLLATTAESSQPVRRQVPREKVVPVNVVTEIPVKSEEIPIVVRRTQSVAETESQPEPVAADGPFLDLGDELPPEKVGKATVKYKVPKYIAKQEELPLDTPMRGRFKDGPETIYNGENLDIPTFRRRGLKILQ